VQALAAGSSSGRSRLPLQQTEANSLHVQNKGAIVGNENLLLLLLLLPFHNLTQQLTLL
jgi:hypothetical protein